VLWLVAESTEAQANLRGYAQRAGINPGRLIFAPRIAYDEHLARLPLADLFLDTFPFNGGATARDALWAGLPVLTCSGDAFASRMAGSLVRAAACSALVTDSLEGYEATALRLATTPALLREIRQRLVAHETGVFLDADRFRRHLESAYLTMWQRHVRGEAADSFLVKPIL
jgi:predicted O-linked N-acetylglucosamine transferase (SPINDLY family)